MNTYLKTVDPLQLTAKPGLGAGMVVPAIIANAGERAAHRFVEFFSATIRNRNPGWHTAAPSARSSPVVRSESWPSTASAR